jgi:hypothetical protein
MHDRGQAGKTARRLTLDKETVARLHTRSGLRAGAYLATGAGCAASAFTCDDGCRMVRASDRGENKDGRGCQISPP